MKGQWKEIKGDVKQRWGNVTDDDLLEIEGAEEKLIGKLQRKYGYARERAEKEYEDFMSHYRKKHS